MSKYSITHSCNHTVEKQLFGPHKARDSKVEWLESQPCMDCLRAEEARKRDEQNKASAEANKLSGYEPLIGSEKQIAWAETIRREALEAFAEVFEKVPVDAKTTWAKTSEWLKTQTQSQWWISTVGTLKSREGLSPLFGLIDGKQPKASKLEIVRALLLLSPHLTEEIATQLGIGAQYRDAVQARLKADARMELEANPPTRPGFWSEIVRENQPFRCNGKIYGGSRVYVSNREYKLSPEQIKELEAYWSAKADWSSKLKQLA